MLPAIVPITLCKESSCGCPVNSLLPVARCLLWPSPVGQETAPCPSGSGCCPTNMLLWPEGTTLKGCVLELPWSSAAAAFGCLFSRRLISKESCILAVPGTSAPCQLLYTTAEQSGDVFEGPPALMRLHGDTGYTPRHLPPENLSCSSVPLCRAFALTWSAAMAPAWAPAKLGSRVSGCFSFRLHQGDGRSSRQVCSCTGCRHHSKQCPLHFSLEILNQ